MSKALNYILGGLLLVSVVAGYLTKQKLLEERLAHQSTQTAYANQVAMAEGLRADEEAKRRKAEKELTDATIAHEQEVLAIKSQRDAARRDDRVVAERLRDKAREAADYAQRAGEVCSDPAFAELRKTTQDTIGMLADLRERADQHAGVLAQFATDAHLAGLACERRYDEAHQKLNSSL